MSAPYSVAELWRYPVKSMAGERLAALHLTARGALGDRALALIDRATGTVASAKHTRRWPNLFAYRAAYAEELAPADEPSAVRITLPDGDTVAGDDPRVAARLSIALGRDVELARAGSRPCAVAMQAFDEQTGGGGAERTFAGPDYAFVDSAPVHLISHATLAALRARHPPGDFDPRRFRANVVVGGTEQGGFVEDEWIGREVAVGAAVLRVVRPTGRCIMVTLAQDELPRDAAIMRTLSARRQASAGVYAEVVTPATVRVHDAVRPL